VGQPLHAAGALGERGISHGDVVDLNRENIPDFDVREFYVNLVPI
jgi:triacylglycerol lipase